MRIGAFGYSKGVEASNYRQLVKAVRRDIEKEVRQCVEVPSWKPSGDGSVIDPAKQVLMTMWAMFDGFERGLRGFRMNRDAALEILDALQHTYTFWSTGRLQLLEEVEKVLHDEKLTTKQRIDELELWYRDAARGARKATDWALDLRGEIERLSRDGRTSEARARVKQLIERYDGNWTEIGRALSKSDNGARYIARKLGVFPGNKRSKRTSRRSSK